jgi:hypothetical protein
VAQPCLVELVDAQVGGDGAVEALLDEDVVAFGVGDLGRRDGAGSWGMLLVCFVLVVWGELMARD